MSVKKNNNNKKATFYSFSFLHKKCVWFDSFAKFTFGITFGVISSAANFFICKFLDLKSLSVQVRTKKAPQTILSLPF